jgi:hypothetical protein
MSTSIAITRKAILPIALAALALVSMPAAAQSSTAPSQRIDFSSNPFNNLFVGPAFRITGLFQLSAPAHLQYSFVTSNTGWSFSLSISQPLVASAPPASSSPASPSSAAAPEQPAAAAKPYELGFNFEYQPAVAVASTMQSLLFASTQPAGKVDMSLNTNGQFTDVNVQGRDGSMMADISVQQAPVVLPVPEPLEWMFMTSGLIAAAGIARRRARRAV